eukprot:gene2077-4056_t
MFQPVKSVLHVQSSHSDNHSDVSDKDESPAPNHNERNVKKDEGCHNELTFREKIFLIALLLLFLVLVIVLGIFLGYFDGPSKNTFSNSVIPNKDGAVVLFGDSMMSYPCHDYDLIGQIKSNLSNLDIGYTNCGEGGNTISHLKNRLEYMLQNIPPITHANLSISSHVSGLTNRNSSVMVILYWDSDCSDMDETTMNEIERQYLRQGYLGHLNYVVYSILHAGAYMAMAGPALLRDQPWKHQMMDEYREMNRNISNFYQIPYIDIRSAYMNSLAAGIDPTKDGEHPNAIGAAIEMRLFSHEIKKWKSYSKKSNKA